MTAENEMRSGGYTQYAHPDPALRWHFHRRRRRGQGGTSPPPLKFGKENFSGNFCVKFGHFGGKNHVKFGQFVNFYSSRATFLT